MTFHLLQVSPSAAVLPARDLSLSLSTPRPLPFSPRAFQGHIHYSKPTSHDDIEASQLGRRAFLRSRSLHLGGPAPLHKLPVAMESRLRVPVRRAAVVNVRHENNRGRLVCINVISYSLRLNGYQRLSCHIRQYNQPGTQQARCGRQYAVMKGGS